MQVKLDKLGRLVVPKSIRSALGIEPGGVLELAQEGGQVTLRPLPKEAPLSVEGGVLVYDGQFAGDVEDAVRRSRTERIEHLGRPA